MSIFFFSSRRRHTRFDCDWSSDVCSSDLMYPVYGLAEASLAVSFPAVGAPLRTITLNRHRMSAGSPVELVPASDRHAVRLVSEGKPIPYCRVRIADDEDRELPEDRIGHVHMRGDNVTRGYYEDPESNASAFTAYA